MKVSELIEMLSKKDQDANVVFAASKLYPTVGGTPSLPVATVSSGFDWDQGKVFLGAPIGNHFMQVSSDEYREAIAWKQLQSGVNSRKALLVLKEKFIDKEELRGKLTSIIEKHFGDWYPSCEESIFQCDKPLIESPAVVAEIMEEFDLFKPYEEEE